MVTNASVAGNRKAVAPTRAKTAEIKDENKAVDKKVATEPKAKSTKKTASKPKK